MYAVIFRSIRTKEIMGGFNLSKGKKVNLPDITAATDDRTANKSQTFLIFYLQLLLD
jgi:hypothetical protein